MWNQCSYMVLKVCEDIYTSTVEWVFAKCSSESNRSTNGDEIISEGLFVSHSSIVVLKMTYHHQQVRRWQPHTKCHRAGRHQPAKPSQHPEAQEHTVVWLPLQNHRKMSNRIIKKQKPSTDLQKLVSRFFLVKSRFLPSQKTEKTLALEIGSAHGTRHPKSRCGLCKASLAHPS